MNSASSLLKSYAELKFLRHACYTSHICSCSFLPIHNQPNVLPTFSVQLSPRPMQTSTVISFGSWAVPLYILHEAVLSSSTEISFLSVLLYASCLRLASFSRALLVQLVIEVFSPSLCHLSLPSVPPSYRSWLLSLAAYLTLSVLLLFNLKQLTCLLPRCIPHANCVHPCCRWILSAAA